MRLLHRKAERHSHDSPGTWTRLEIPGEPVYNQFKSQINKDLAAGKVNIG
jgi:hypothetical protein